MADKFIKQINLGTASTPNLYDIYDEYARRRLEGLTNVYSISCQHAGSSSNTYVDYITGETITYSTMAIANTSFNSTDETITIAKTADKTTYIVLESKTPSGGYYAVRFLDMHIGDTVYVVEAKIGETIIPDRWLSSAVEDTSATFTILDGKIDLKEYAKKTVAAKAGTYTTSAASTETSGQGGAQTATGTATVTYKKADATTGAAGAATVTSTTAGAVSIEYTPVGSISGSQTIASHSHTVNLAKSDVTYVSSVAAATAETGAHTHSVEVSGDITLGDLSVQVGEGTPTYTPSGTISQPTFSSGAAESAGGHTHAVTAAGKISVGTGTVNYTPAGDIDVAVDSHTYTPEGSIAEIVIAEHSHTVNAATDSYTAVTAIPNFTGGALNAATAKTVVTGVTAASLTGDTTFATAVTGDKNYGFTASVSNVMTAPTVVENVLQWTAVDASTQDVHSVSTGTVGITGGAASGTTSVVPSYTLTPAALGTLTTGSITYMKSATIAVSGGTNVTPVFTGTKATLSHTVSTKSFTGTGVELKFTGSSVTSTTAGAHTHSVTGTVSQPTFTGTGVELKVAGGSVSGTMSGTAASAGAHAHNITSTTATFSNVTGATLAKDGAATVNFTNATFTGTPATLTQLGHTHDVVVADHIHTIGTTDDTVTGSVSVAVTNHTHSIGHTHTTTLPDCQE